MVNFNATLIAQVLNFLILVFILAKFAYKPLMKIMDDRKNKIAGDLAAAETAKTDAESIKAEYAAKLAAARQEAQAIIDNARKTAQTAHDKILADTKAEQDQIESVYSFQRLYNRLGNGRFMDFKCQIASTAGCEITGQQYGRQCMANCHS